MRSMAIQIKMLLKLNTYMNLLTNYRHFKKYTIMANKFMDTSFLDRAIVFAVKAHSNSERRDKGFPYIVHSMEAMEIVATITPDQEIDRKSTRLNSSHQIISYAVF